MTLSSLIARKLDGRAGQRYGRSAPLDAAMLSNGDYVLPNARRFFSAAHTDEDLDVTLTAPENPATKSYRHSQINLQSRLFDGVTSKYSVL
jgi:hypothetical protein